MNVTGPIIKLIANNGTSNSLLGGRVYPWVIKQGSAYPAAAVNVTGVSPTNTKTSASDLDFCRVQIDIYAATPTAAAETADAVRGALDYYTGSVTLTGGGTEYVEHIQYERELTGFSETPELFRIIQEYTYIAS